MDIQTINIIALFSGPILAVVITLIYQSQKEKRAVKVQLFTTLMAHRKTLSVEWVNALNLVDVVFSEHAKVVALWHEYYALLHVESPEQYRTREKTCTNLLAEMGKVLGYKNLQQVDIDKFYTPVAHGEQSQMNARIQTEWLRILENTNHFLVALRVEQQNPEAEEI